MIGVPVSALLIIGGAMYDFVWDGHWFDRRHSSTNEAFGASRAVLSCLVLSCQRDPKTHVHAPGGMS